MYYMADLIRRRNFSDLIRTMLERNRVHGVSLIDQAQHFVLPILPAPVRSFVLRQRDRLVKHAWLESEAMQSFTTAPPVREITPQSNGLPAVTDIASLCLVLTFSSKLQQLLHWEDRNSMAHSIEARVPFLDHRLVEFSLALGNDHKIVRADTKRILRRAMAHTLPAAVLQRTDKLGFSRPPKGDDC